GNVFATAPNDVLLAIHEMQIALSVAPNDVAGVEPAIFPGFVSGLGVFKIAGKETEAGIVSGVAYQQFALLIRAHRFACIIDDAHLDIVLFLAEATGSDKAWLAVGNDDGARACFGHGPGLEQGNAETLFESCVQTAVDTGAKAEAHLMISVVRALRCLHQNGGHNSQVVEDGGA